ncbi:hypothetical protein [Cerasicoccus fimbriatus]|uniref:hypothetical protein n=1 Tax=Cerasicoccus fimbriatus TaxID=3014554 RepID=UPI0022B42C6B|nr:hypothetical protein [Cerasicoccus sp. TK19100]
MKRSEIYAAIADKLGPTCNASIDDAGYQRIDESHGKLSDGNIYYCIGEMYRVRGVQPGDLLGRDYVQIAHALISRWEEMDTLKGCFAAMGLAMLGPDSPEHPILGKLCDAKRAKVEKTLRVTRAFPHNWEVFNASLRMGRSVLWGDDPALVLPHLDKLVKKYEVSGYFDDSANSGDYNNYGLMTINFALRLSEFLPVDHVVRREVEAQFKVHAMRYFELLKSFIGPQGEGWLFGRSSGVLGQLQCISYLEQLLSKGWFSAEDAAWSRRACRELTQYMQDVFWDEGGQWFLFRDENRQCYNYRTTLPMTWDLWRYFLQLENYARIDEALPQNELETLPCKADCREIITSVERRTTYLVWSDDHMKWQMPIMGGPTTMAGDSLPRPYLPGLFEWVTGNDVVPALCPEFQIGEEKGWPAWWPKSTKLQAEGDNWRYTVKYAKLCGRHGEALGWPVSVRVEYHFGTGFFERIDHLEVSGEIEFDSVRLEILQGAPHPKAQRYPKVYQINSAMQSNLPGLTVEEVDVSADPRYRNYFSHPAKSYVLSGEKVTLVPGSYTIESRISWSI